MFNTFATFYDSNASEELVLFRTDTSLKSYNKSTDAHFKKQCFSAFENKLF